MLAKVMATISRYKMVDPGNKVLVGISGGPDSLALFHILYFLKDKLNITLHLAHLNHMFRGEEARADAEFVKKLANDYQVPCTVEEIDVPAYVEEKGLSAQEGAREVRYGFLFRVAEEVNAQKIALGHNANDQAETIIMNFLRGGGLTGLSGIPPVRDNIIIRPLIKANREEIEEYCRLNNLEPRLDSSNLKTVYLRNKIRFNLLPRLKEYNPNIVETLSRMADILRDEDGFITREALNSFNKVCLDKDKSRLVFDLREFNNLNKALKRRIIIISSHFLNPLTDHLGFDHVEEILGFLSKEARGQRQIKPFLWVHLEKEKFIISSGKLNKDKIPFFSYPLKIPGETKVPELNIIIRTKIFNREPDRVLDFDNPDIIYLDYEQIPHKLLVRQRKPGDKFQPLGMKGTKKLKDYFIDLKVPCHLRDSIPVIASDNDVILWVAGMRISNTGRINNKTRQILEIELVKIEIQNNLC